MITTSYRSIAHCLRGTHPLLRTKINTSRTKCSKAALRHFTTKTNDALLVLGNSNVGWSLAKEGLKQGYRVMITTRRNPDAFPKHKNISYIHTPEQSLKDGDFWEKLTQCHVSGEEKLFVASTIGGSIPSANESIEDLNINIPLAAVKGIDKAFKNGISSVVHLSTMAAAGLQAPYGKTKREVEDRLMELPLKHLTIFRMGYVVDALIRNQVTHSYKAHHRLSLEELSLLPFHFLVGDPAQYNKILVPIVSAEDVATATFNVFKRPPQVKIIDAVSREIITQEQFSRFLTDLLGKKFRPIYIPIDAANKLEKHHTFGHLISYAIEYCAMKHNIRLDPEAFEELVGRPLKTLNDIYNLEPDQELLIPRPPLAEFATHVLKNLWNKPESRRDTLDAVKILTKSLLNNKNTVPLRPIQNPAPKNGYPWTTVSEKDFSQHAEQNR